jgi:hypothetical protein
LDVDEKSERERERENEQFGTFQVVNDRQGQIKKVI